MNKSAIIIFAAPSGSGKSTIIDNLLKTNNNLEFSVSATTRNPRNGEVDGKDYFFLTEEVFLQKISDNEFIEWEKFYDYYYGTLKSFVDQKLEKGISLIFDVDVKGAVSLKQKFENAVSIFIMPPTLEILKERLIKRNSDTPEDLAKRIARAELELTYKEKFDHIVINDNLDKAILQTKEIIDKKINGEKNGN